MISRKFAKLSYAPSLLGFGCMRLPLLENGKIDFLEAKKMLTYAYENGVTYFDTAYPYHGGESELVVGEIIKDFKRESIYLTTKLPAWELRKEEDILRIFNEQLKKLQVEYVDTYLLHALNKERYDLLLKYDIFTKMDKLIAEGKIKNLGFSFHGTLEDFIYILEDGLPHWQIVQIQLNYMDTDIQQGITGYNLLEKYDIPALIMEPIKGGALAKLPDDIAKKFLDYDKNSSMASWALRYAASYKNVVCLLSGMSTYEQVDDNLKTFNNFSLLNEKETELVKEVSLALKARVFVPCTGCEYCMPCPLGVNIKKSFAIFNDHFKYETVSKLQVAEFVKETNIDKCLQCGACISKCPQSIFIPDFLERIRNILKI
jgi:predicted aldo/keto reductase-like oxidoreductase